MYKILHTRGLTSLCLFLLLPLWFSTELKGAVQYTYQTDTIIDRGELPTIYVDSHKRKPKPLTKAEREALWRRIRDVKRTLPYAKYVVATIIETYEYMETLPEKEQKAHLKRVERELRKEMEPKMRQLTLGQGKILMKLIHRQSGSTSYQLVKAYLGGWRAWWWNQFAKVIGANMKTPYNPEEDPDDALTERIVILVEAGML